MFCQARWRWWLVLVLFLAVFGVWWSVYLATPPGILTIAFLDVGQGDAIFIEAPNGNQLLIDGGRGGQVLSALNEVMPWFDRSFEVVMATHPDADHMGGLVAVLSRYSVDQTVDPSKSSPTQTYQTYRRLIDSKKITNLTLSRGAKIILDQGVEFMVLSPSGEVDQLETNEASIVGKLTYGRNTVLLTGDAPNYVEQNLLFRGLAPELGAEILKVGHHGSKHSSSLAFIEAVKPTYAVISVGATNSYGHPHPSVLERLNSKNIKTLRTDQLGTIIFTGDGVTFRAPPAL